MSSPPFGSPINTPPLYQTTLTAAIPANTGDPGASFITIIPLASIAGIARIMLNQLQEIGPETEYFLQIDNELMAVVGLEAQNSVKVIRGIEGTDAVAHAVGATVYYGLGPQFQQN